MTVPEPLREHISSARASIARATGIDAAMHAKNAGAFLTTAAGYAVLTPELSDAFEQARLRIEDFRTEAAGRHGISQREKDSIENARQPVMVALDRLEGRFDGARPSELATALGLDWF